jgi:hypothetical protein
MIVLHPETLEIPARKDDASKVGVDGFEERLGRGKTQIGTRHVLVSPVAVDSELLQH